MAAKKYMVGIDLQLNELQNAVIQKLASDPVSPVEGQFWYNTTSDVLKYYDGASVQTLAIGANLTNAVTLATIPDTAGTLLVSGSTENRSVVAYAGGAGLLKVSAAGVVSTASAGTDYLTADSTNTLTNKTFDANGTGNSLSNVEVADLAAAALTSDISASALSTQLATADVIKTYVDNSITALGNFVGDFDASGEALPTTGGGIAGAISKGDYWRVSVAGTITGLGLLEVGDVLTAKADEADAAEEFFLFQGNVTDSVTSSAASSTDNALPRFDGESGKVIQASPVTVDDNGSVNIPSGQAYKVDGVDIMTTLGASALAHKFAAAFNDTTDWAGASAPFTRTIAAATHGLGASQDIMVQVRDSSNAVVELDVTTDTDGLVTLTSNTKFAGRVMLVA